MLTPESDLFKSDINETGESATPEDKEHESTGPRVMFVDSPVFAGHNREKLLDDGLKGAEIPKGAHSVATYLGSVGFDTQLVPMDAWLKGTEYPTEESMYPTMLAMLDEKIAEFNPTVLAFGMMYTFTVPSVLVMIDHIKTKYPDRTIIVGGNHATFMARELIEENAGIDYVVIGEGESTTRELLEELNKPEPQVWKIKGIAFRGEDGLACKSAPRTRADLRQLPPLDYKIIHKPDGMDLAEFNHTVMFTRGCEANCAFCTSPLMWNKDISLGSMGNFERELNYLVDNGITAIGLLDDDLLAFGGASWRAMAPVLRQVHTAHPEVDFFAQTRVTHMIKKETWINKDQGLRGTWNPDQFIAEMKEVGVKRIYLGIESGSQVILNGMKKAYKLPEALEACRNVKAGGLEIGAFWIFGHPGATPEEEEKSITFLQQLLDEGLLADVEAHCTVPFPGTAIAQDKRIRLKPERKNDWAEYGVINNDPVYDLIDVDPKTGEPRSIDLATGEPAVVLSAAQIRSYLDRAQRMRFEYLGIAPTSANSPLS